MMNYSEVLIIAEERDPLVSQPQITWAIGYLSEIFQTKSIQVVHSDLNLEEANGRLCIIVASSESAFATQTSKIKGIQLPNVPEAFAIISNDLDNQQTITVVGSDTRGLVYGLLELADIAKYSSDALQDLRKVRSYMEKPTNPVRSITRLFTNELEDKPWFYNRNFGMNI